MPKIPRARHFGYDWAGRPIVRILPDVACADNIPEFLGTRHFSYGLSGLPFEAYAWECCDAICSQAEIDSNDCYKLPLLWPLGPGPGITKRVVVYLSDVNSCFSSIGKKAVLTYSVVDDKWHGSVSLRGCTLTLTFSVNPGLPGDPGKFTLEYDGGTPSDQGSLSVGYFCSDPLTINFGQATLPLCCTCPASGTGTTDTPAEVAFYAVANCRHPRFGRHSYYDNGIPVVVKSRNCLWDQVDPTGCGIITCPLSAAITDVSGCACLEGTYTLDYLAGAWEYASGYPCTGSPGQMTVSCTDAGVDSQGRKLVQLSVDIVCGAAAGGSGSKIILASEMEDLDETVQVTITRPSSSCTDCSFEYNEMTAAWMLLSGCEGSSCGACGESPSNPPANPLDYTTTPWTEPCPGDPGNECCSGTVDVRVTRA